MSGDWRTQWESNNSRGHEQKNEDEIIHVCNECSNKKIGCPILNQIYYLESITNGKLSLSYCRFRNKPINIHPYAFRESSKTPSKLADSNMQSRREKTITRKN